MPIRLAQLEAQLRSGLKPAYLISGDEPQQVEEAAELVRRAARDQGHEERVVLALEAGFDWSRLAEEARARSLFAQKRLLELRLGAGKPGRTGGAALLDYLLRPPDETVLLIQSARLDRAAANSRWVKALEKKGVWVAVWPLLPSETHQWVRQRLKARGLHPDEAALELLCERVEGNLLAAAQEVERLALLLPSGPLSVEAVQEAVGGSARFDVSALGEAVLAGDALRASRILDGLRKEGVEPALAAWALAREARFLARWTAGHSGSDLWRGVFPRRRELLQRAAARWPRKRSLGLIRLAARLDRVVKGQEKGGDPWDELLQFALFLSGKALFPPADAIGIEETGVIRKHERK